MRVFSAGMIAIVFGAFLLMFLGSPIATRADALDNWTSQTIVSNVGGTLRDIAYGNGRFVVVGDAPCDPDHGAIFTSDDGLQWVFRRSGCSEPTDTLYELLSVTYGQNAFVAAGWMGRIYASSNGIGWTVQAMAPLANFYDVAYGGGRFVSVGDSTVQGGSATLSNIYTSTNGMDWVPSRSGSAADTPYPIYSVAYCNDPLFPGFVAIGAGGIVYSSVNGSLWSRASLPLAVYFGSSIEFCNGQFIVPAGVGTNLVSTYGAPWTIQTNDSAVVFRKVVFSHGVYIGWGYSPVLSADMFLTSTNGRNWTQRSFSRPHPAKSIDGFGLGERDVVAFGSDFGFPATHCSVFTSDPLLSFNAKAFMQINISGLAGASYRIEFLTNLVSNPPNNWQILTSFSLPTSPFVVTDTQAANVSQRFYRAVLLP